MKSFLSITLAILLFASLADAATAVTEENAWQETYSVKMAAPKLQVSNIWGSVRVRAGKPGEISVEISERRSAPDLATFELSMEILSLNIEADASGVSIRVGDSNERWQRMNNCDGCRVDYQFEILVPPDAEIDVGTVLDGAIDIKAVAGQVSASNVNGPIAVEDIHDCATVNSVNGKVKLAFSKAPLRNCSIETINGDITLDVPSNASLDVAIDLFNGDIKTDFPVGPFTLPATVEHTTDNGRNQYRIQQLSGIRIGAGGPTYSIASMNGDVRIQKLK